MHPLSLIAMNKNTVKTTIGYVATLVRKYTPFKTESNSLADIYNYLAIDEMLATSGQPTEKQLSLIKDAGYVRVINLAPASAENALGNEADLLESLGLDYVHIPVNFKKPSERKFKLFVDAMQQTNKEKTWVHCAANMRVSAFVYRYRKEVLLESTVGARKDLERIWEPFGVWKTFIEN